jgi:hypothetical protein
MINLEAEGREKLTSLFVDRLKEALQLKTPLNFLTEFQLSAFASYSAMRLKAAQGRPHIQDAKYAEKILRQLLQPEPQEKKFRT